MDGAGVPGGLRRLVEAGRRPPARVRLLEELEVFRCVHPRDRRRAERGGGLRLAETGLGQRGEDAIDVLGDLRRIDEYTVIEKRGAR